MPEDASPLPFGGNMHFEWLFIHYIYSKWLVIFNSIARLILKARMWKTAFTRFPVISTSIYIFSRGSFCTFASLSQALRSLWSNLIECAWPFAKAESQPSLKDLSEKAGFFVSFSHPLLCSFYLWRLKSRALFF